MRFKNTTMAALTALALLAGGAGGAHAATSSHRGQDPFPLGKGDQDWMVVDSHGAAHVVWLTEPGGSNPDVVHYCRVQRHATACSQTQQLIPKLNPIETMDPIGPKIALLASGRLVVATPRCCLGLMGPYIGSMPVYTYSSTDGGASFSGPTQINSNPPGGDFEAGPGDDTVSTITSGIGAGLYYQASPAGGGGLGPSPALLSFGAPSGSVNDGTVALVNATTPIAAFSDMHDNIYARVWSGSVDVNINSSWTPVKTVAHGDDPRLVGGARGVFLAYLKGAGGTQQPLVFAHFDGTSFGAPRAVPGATDAKKFNFTETSSGVLVAIWKRVTDQKLREARSPDGGRTWSRPVTLASNPGGIYYPHVRAAPDGQGFAVYDTEVTQTGTVMAVALPPMRPAVVRTGGTRLRHRRTIRIRLACPRTMAFCAGKLRLRTRTRLHGKRRKLGAKRFKVRGGRTRTTHIRLKRGIARLIRNAGRRRLGVSAKVTWRKPVGRARTGKRRVTLTVPRRSARLRR